MADVGFGMSGDYVFLPSPVIIAADIDKMALDIRSFRVPLTRSVQQVMIPSIQENFASGGRPAWQSVADATRQIKANLGASLTPLTRTGALKRNMGYVSMWDITTSQATIAALPDRISYGSIHQSGSQSGSGRGSNIPARPFAVFQDADEEKISQVFDQWLAERARAAGW